MKHYRQSHIFSICCCFFVLFSGCTENPFSGDEQKISSRTISGSVYLEDGSKLHGIFVWLENINVGTRTDENGDFHLALPPPATKGTAEGTDGVFNLYFYVANYQIDSAQVVIVNSEVARSEGDINANGELRKPKYLSKILSIKTEVFPQSIRFDTQRQVNVSIKLQAVSTSVIIESLIRVENKVLKRTGLILIDDEGNFVRAIGLDSSWKMGSEIIQSEPKVWKVKLFWPPCNLPVGRYQMIPYFLVKQNNVPPKLIESLGMNVKELGPNYLDIPFVRQVGEFIITPPPSF